MKSVFGLDTHLDLYKKLEWEFTNLKGNPNNPYLAYNFFVTAWHLLEWKYPDPGGKKSREGIRNQNPLLQICHHLAVGAKHFTISSPIHKSVLRAGKNSVWGRSWGNSWGNSWSSHLEVELINDAQKLYGSRIAVVDLAQHVMDYWKNAI